MLETLESHKTRLRTMTTIPKPVRKQELTPERVKSLLEDVQFMGTIIQLLENRWRNNLFDVNLRSQTMKNFNRQIFNGIQGLKRELHAKFRLKQPDELEFEMATEMDRVISFFCLLPAESIDIIMTSLEQQAKEQGNEK